MDLACCNFNIAAPSTWQRTIYLIIDIYYGFFGGRLGLSFLWSNMAVAGDRRTGGEILAEYGNDRTDFQVCPWLHSEGAARLSNVSAINLTPGQNSFKARTSCDVWS